MKYIIDVDGRISKHGKLELLCEVENALPQYICTTIDARPYAEPDRKTIEDEVWNFAAKIERMTCREVYEVFGIDPAWLCNQMSYQEAKAKYEAWKKQNDEIKVGDEIEDVIRDKGVVVYKYSKQLVDILWDDGSVTEDNSIEGVRKTGRHFPEVTQLLEKMRGES